MDEKFGNIFVDGVLVKLDEMSLDKLDELRDSMKKKNEKLQKESEILTRM